MCNHISAIKEVLVSFVIEGSSNTCQQHLFLKISKTIKTIKNLFTASKAYELKMTYVFVSST